MSTSPGEIPPQPRAAVRIEKTDFPTVTAIDPYRWMEDTTSPEFQAWAAAQHAHTRATLDRVELRSEMLARIQMLAANRDEAKEVKSRGGKLFYLKRPAAADTFQLYVRDRKDERDRLLINPTAAVPGASASIDFYSPSPDGRRVAFGTAMNGSEDSVLRILDVDTGTMLPDTIDRAWHAEPHWLPDGQSFFYQRTPAVDRGAPSADRYQRSRDYLHILGSDPDHDATVFGYGVTPHVPVAAADSPYVYLWQGCPYAFGLLQHGTSNDSTGYMAPLTSIDAERTPWRKLFDVNDQVLDIAVHGAEVFLLTHRDAPRGKVIRVRLDSPDLARADVVIPASDAVITRVMAASDALYVQTLDRGLSHMARLAYDGTAPQPLALPFEGSIAGITASPAEPGVAFQLQSWTRPKLYYAYRPALGRFTDLGLISSAGQKYPQLESIETQAKSRDGTMVPLSIVYLHGLDRAHPHPALLSAYGNYGSSINPSFDPRRLAWLERGGIYAVAHVRGGGEYGEEWHVAGMKQRKQNTFDDFIACAQFLIEHGYTSNGQLAGEGSSAGGLTIGSAITQRPDLFGAALVRVGIVDALRFETTAIGPLNAVEFGSIAVPDEVQSLYDMSPYYHVTEGTCYPAVLLTGSSHDARVPIWQPAKLAARLQAATASGKPILLRLDSGSGHGYGFGTTNSRFNEELADCYTFLLSQLPHDIGPRRKSVRACVTSKN